MGEGAVRSQTDLRICFRIREPRDVDLVLVDLAVACAVLTDIGRLPAAKVHPCLRLEYLPQLIPGGYRGSRRGRLEWIQVGGIPGQPRARHEGLAMRQYVWLARSRPILLL